MWKSRSIVGRATLIAEKSLAIDDDRDPIANSASQLIALAPVPSIDAAGYVTAPAVRYPAPWKWPFR